MWNIFTVNAQKRQSRFPKIWKNFSIGIHVSRVLAISLVRMRQNNVNSTYGLKTTVTIVFSGHNFL